MSGLVFYSPLTNEQFKEIVALPFPQVILNFLQDSVCINCDLVLSRRICERYDPLKKNLGLFAHLDIFFILVYVIQYAEQISTFKL